MYTYDTIPLKLYFKVVETGNLSLLGNHPESELSKLLEDISEQRSKKDSKGKSKELDVYCQMEALSAKYQAIQYAIYYLRQMEDADLIEMLKSKGYKFSEDYKASLDEIENISSGILVKIEAVKKRLPKKKEAESKEIPLDEVILSYCALLEMGFVDTNTVTLSQYDSIITLGNRKMEALNKGNNGGK